MSVKERLEEAVPINVDDRVPHEILPVITNVADAQAILSLIEAAEEISVASPAEYESEGLKYDLRQVDKDAWRELLVALKAVTE